MIKHLLCARRFKELELQQQTRQIRAQPHAALSSEGRKKTQRSIISGMKARRQGPGTEMGRYLTLVVRETSLRSDN